jgi:hypothetical protein
MSRRRRPQRARARALALSDAQMRAVQAAACCVPVEHRPDYLNGIADELVRLEQITDADVLAAATRASSCWSTPLPTTGNVTGGTP